jgi:hypothetical protein
MEDVLDLYAAPPDPARPIVCLDECPVQLRDDVRGPLPAAPGRPRRRDYEYRRCGTACLAVAFAPHRGWRHVGVGEHRTKADFAGWLKDVVDVHYPTAEVIRLVVDNLNTHTPAALYEAFAPAEAHRIARKLEWHYTPKHGSWLNMVEIELSVLAAQCGAPPGPPAAPRPGHAGTGDRRLRRAAQRRTRHDPLALHHRRRPDQARPPLPDPSAHITTVGSY